MRYPFLIDNYGVKNPSVIYVYNWHTLNQIGNAAYETPQTHIICEDFCVAIFKIKYKQP